MDTGLRRENATNKEMGSRSDPIGTEKALVLALGEAFQQELLGIGFGVAKFLQRTKAALEHSAIALGPEHPIRRF